MLRDMFKQRKQIFSIRKTVLGVGSVLLGVLLTTGFVSAEEVQAAPVTENTELVLASDSAVTQPTVTETVIKSPIRYVDDPTQEVGYRVVQTQGTDGNSSIPLQQMVKQPCNVLNELKQLLF